MTSYFAAGDGQKGTGQTTSTTGSLHDESPGGAAADVPRPLGNGPFPATVGSPDSSPGTPAGPFGHPFPEARADAGDIYVSYRRQYRGYDGYDRDAVGSDMQSFSASSASSFRHPGSPLQFPPMPRDALGIDGADEGDPPSLLPQSLLIGDAQQQQPQQQQPQAPPTPDPVLAMPSMPPTPAPPTPRPRDPVPRAPVYQPPPEPRPAPARIEAQPPSAARFIAIGIDFGTTYSGVSWAHSNYPNDIREIKNFPFLGASGGRRDDTQVPTLYDQQNGRWGYQVDHSAATLRWFKLLLLRDDDIPDAIRQAPYVQALRAQVRRLDESGVVDVVAGFLERLWQHSLQEIALQLDATYLSTLPLRVALTVPAIWKPYACSRMLEAARRARITAPRAGASADVAPTTLVLVAEPEAAAVATLLNRRALPDMAVGDTCVVCDCGGGTVDVISYRLRSTEPLELAEAAGGNGRLCGAVLVDDRFEAHLRRQPGLNLADLTAADYQRFVLADWEHTLKRNFCDADHLPAYTLHPPQRALGLTALVLRKDSFVVDKDTVRGFFQPTLDGIFALIDEQYRAIRKGGGRSPRRIILVGGLGSSRYLYEQLQARYHNVVQPDRCWSAVASGAVIKLLKSLFGQRDIDAAADAAQRRALRAVPALAARVARCSYGVKVGVPVADAVPPLQPGERVLADPGAGASSQLRVWRMKWYLRRGELMDNRAPVSYGFVDYVKCGSSATRHVEIYTSLQMPPPRCKDASCRLLCTLACAYDVPFADLPVVPGKPKMRVVPDIRLTMRFEGQPEWRLQVGNRTVSEKLPVDFEG